MLEQEHVATGGRVKTGCIWTENRVSQSRYKIIGGHLQDPDVCRSRRPCFAKIICPSNKLEVKEMDGFVSMMHDLFGVS